MSLINNFGPETNPIWVILDAPYDNDLEEITGPGLSSTIIRDEILSGGYGYNFKKIWKMGGLSLNDIHIRSIKPCIGATYVKENVLSNLLFEIERWHPTIIVPLSDEVLNYLVP